MEAEALADRARDELLVDAVPVPPRPNSIVTLLLLLLAPTPAIALLAAPSGSPPPAAPLPLADAAEPEPELEPCAAPARSPREVTNEKAGARPLLPARLRFCGTHDEAPEPLAFEFAFAEEAAPEPEEREPELASGICCCELAFSEAAPSTVRLYSTRSLSRIGTKHCAEDAREPHLR